MRTRDTARARCLAALVALAGLARASVTLAQTACVVRSPAPSLTSVTVDLGGDAVALDVDDAEAEATLPTMPGGPVAVRVTAALHFAGVAPTAPFALRDVTTVGGDLVSLSPSAVIERVRATPTGAAVFDAVIGPSVVVRDVEAACGALRLGPPATATEPSIATRALAAHPGDSTLWTHIDEVLTLTTDPASGARVLVSFTRREDSWQSSPTFVRLSRAGDWSRVMLAQPDGVVTGWVPQRALQPHPGTLGGGGTGSGGCHGCAADPPPHAGPHDYLGPARIEPGTAVRSMPGGAAWATVRRATGYRVLARSGEAWVSVVEIPGVRVTASCHRNLGRAFVPRSAVRLLGAPTTRARP